MSFVDRKSIDNFKSFLADYLMSKHSLNINRPFNCLSPTHEDRHPSMSYSPKYNICKCFSCGACYDIFDLIGIDYNTDSFKDKLEIASELYPNVADIVFDRYDVIENNNTVIDFTNYFKKCISKINETDYLERRSIDKSLYEKYKIGYDDKRKMVVFPINKNCYFGRSVVGENKSKSKGTSYLWNEELLKNSDENTLIYVTESIINSLSLETIDSNVKTVALNGALNYKRLIKVVKENNFNGFLVLAFDNDRTGLKYQEITKEELADINVNSFSTTLISNLDPEECNDINDALIKHKDKLIENYNYFNDNFKIIIDKKNKEKGSDLEL